MNDIGPQLGREGIDEVVIRVDRQGDDFGPAAGDLGERSRDIDIK